MDLRPSLRTRMADRGWLSPRLGLGLVAIASLAGIVFFIDESRGGKRIKSVTGPMVVDGEHGKLIENVHITSSSGPCLVIKNSSNVTVRDSEIGPCGGNGIEVASSKNVRIVDSYVHPEFRVTGCCDKGNGIFAHLSSDILIQGNVVAYGESNVQLLGVKNVEVKGNFLLNPLGPFPRGQQIQVWGRGGTRSANILVETNYTLASIASEYAFSDGQWDAINLGYTDGAVVRNNYIQGGRSHSGCGLIADDSANNMQFLDNTLVNTGQCGIGIASGTNQVVDGNRILNNGLTIPSVGNTAVYVWKQYSAPCGPVRISNNVAVMKRANGAFTSYWKGSGCDTTTLTNNTFDRAAEEILAPIELTNPPPPIPPLEYSRKPATPFSGP
ncbi:MAG TPA: right-handed parallel beta-helix repeat-containing protein [Dehalococcoidia bacterium]|nr:right-handed parallel beta-helix repeat-containing protein [Dehalococcoidia bacterium]